ncbi:unnamed protein product [Sphagnum troendelagicum]|uniref:Kinesin motor domain-containing protein n=1 Tax=Sphagnum troendelagicum TaxID=128251 RepID=A0ABP0T8J9_9BRYO
MVKGGGTGRARVIRGSDSQQQQWERDPFGLGASRHKSSSPVVGGGTTTVHSRKLRHMSENIPPDAPPTNVLDGVPCKSVGKGARHQAIDCKESPVPSSPALLPKLPKPAVVRAEQEVLAQISPTNMGLDLPDAGKRKMNVETMPGRLIEDMMNAPAGESSELDTGVKVIVRMRPLNRKEEAEEASHVVQKLSSNSLLISDQQFTFDAVVGEGASQQAVFEMVGLPMVENCLAGFNSSIFAYGQTGSGKTHTMWGQMPGSNSADYVPTEDRGITPRIFEQLFSRIQQEERDNVDKQLWFQCRCSFLEIYNEQITDLLEPSLKNLMIREDTKTGVYVESLTEEYVSTMADVTHLIMRGLANRRVGSTSMNNESSRSHSVFTFVIESRSKSVAEGVSSVRSSRMNLVDLAGSERQKRTGAAGERLKEAGNINKSLSQLGNVINILAEASQTGKQRHIPYRDSRLTFLLQESLGGNAKLAMICAISPASSCKSETLSTLRFAQRAKAMQNKAVVNEETANDVKLLREQIRQLKEELMKMKVNSSNPQEGGSAGFSNGWSARRSYNILRLSLGQPMMLPSVDAKDFDEKMEIDQEEEDVDPSGLSSPKDDDDDHLATIQMELYPSPNQNDCQPAIIETELHTPPNHEETEELDNVVIELAETAQDSEPAEVYEENQNTGKLPIELSDDAPDLDVTKLPELPTLSLSPRVLDNKRSQTDISLGGIATSGRSSLGYSVRSSKALSSSRDELAASLTRGLEILSTQQRSSLSAVRRSAGMQFSFQNADLKTRSSAKSETLLCTPDNDSNAQGGLDSKNLNIPETGLDLLSPDPQSPDTRDQTKWQLVPTEPLDKKILVTPQTPANNSQVSEAVLAGALRRERAAEEVINEQAAEIEQLNRLVRQYKNERECNAVIQQSREEKIARMEKLVDGVLPAHEFRLEEWLALQLEFEMLQEKFNEHPDVTEAKMKQQCLENELQRLKTFCKLGEREALQKEITQLRNQLQLLLETGTPGSLKQRRLSLTPKNSILTQSPNKPLLLSVVHEASPLQDSASSSGSPQGQPELSADKRLDEEQREWDEREREWISVVQDLREESHNHKQLAEKWKKELEGEKRCAQEMHDALQMAMEGHARLLNQYAELQEKHTLLLAKVREIRDGVSDIKKVAKRSGMNATEARWFDVQSSQIVAMKIELDREKKAARQEIEALHVQLQDTADAVQAAGELLVRLKEAEEATSIAKNAAAMATQDAEGMRCEIKKLKKQHRKEVIALQEHLFEAISQRSSVCSKCGTSNGMKTQSEMGDAASCVKDIPWTSELEEVAEQKWKNDVNESWSCDEGLAGEEHLGGEEPEEEIERLTFSRSGYQFLENLDIEEFDDDDDEFLCESCGERATNSTRMCNSCI